MACELESRPMDNACFQPDTSVEMEWIENECGISVEKEKKTVNFEKNLPTKVNNSDSLIENTAGDSINLQRITNEIKPQPTICQADLCKETIKNIQEIAQKNQTFDPHLKMKTIVFTCLCIGIFFWSILHFGFF